MVKYYYGRGYPLGIAHAYVLNLLLILALCTGNKYTADLGNLANKRIKRLLRSPVL